MFWRNSLQIHIMCLWLRGYVALDLHSWYVFYQNGHNHNVRLMNLSESINMLYTSFYNILCYRLSLQCSNTTKEHYLLSYYLNCNYESYPGEILKNLFPLSLVPPEPTLRCPSRCLHWFLDKAFCLQQNHTPNSSENDRISCRVPDLYILTVIFVYHYYF